MTSESKPDQPRSALFAESLAQNVRQLREGRGMSQSALARRAGIPRATLSLLESGSANPTLALVLRVAETLSVRIEELLEPPPTDTLVYRAAELPSRPRLGGSVRPLLPQSLAGIGLEELWIRPGQTLVGIPHTIGTREYLIVQSGSLSLALAGERFSVGPGDVAVFRGHQKHSYHNPGVEPVRALSVIALNPEL